MASPDAEYARSIRLLFRLVLAALIPGFFWFLFLALSGPTGTGLEEAWSQGESPFWTGGQTPLVWIIALPPLIPTLSSIYLALSFFRARRRMMALLALSQGGILLGAMAILLL